MPDHRMEVDSTCPVFFFSTVLSSACQPAGLSCAQTDSALSTRVIFPFHSGRLSHVGVVHEEQGRIKVKYLKKTRWVGTKKMVQKGCIVREHCKQEVGVEALKV